MHIGKRIKEVLEEKGLSITWLSEQIPCERSNVYNMFRRENIGVGLLLKLSIVMQHDFFAELSEEYRATLSGNDECADN